MNNNVKLLIGGTIGGAVGYFIGSIIVEVIELKNNPPEHYDGTGQYDEGTDGLVLETGELPKMNVTKTVKNYTVHFKSEGRPDLAELTEKYRGEATEEEDVIKSPKPINKEDPEIDQELLDDILADEAEIDTDQGDEPIDPYIISLSEYANADENTNCVTLNYYDDGIVTNEKDQPVDRPTRFLGEEALESFGVLSEDPDVVYVRNMARNAMYEIVKTNKPYKTPSESPRDRAARKMALRKDGTNGEAANT